MALASSEGSDGHLGRTWGFNGWCGARLGGWWPSEDPRGKKELALACVDLNPAVSIKGSEGGRITEL